MSKEDQRSTSAEVPEGYKIVGPYLVYEGPAYQISINSDRIEGRGRSEVCYYTLTREDANDIVSKEGSGHISESHTLILVPMAEFDLPDFKRSRVIHKTFPLTHEFLSQAEKKQRALAKLTDDEKVLLGITP